MVKKWAGEFKRGRESLEDDPRPGRLHNAWLWFCQVKFPFSRSRRLKTANWLRLIICNRKTRNGYSFKLAVLDIHQLSRSAHVPNYNCTGHNLGRELIEHPYTVDFWICMFDDACHSWTEMFLCLSIERIISLKRLFQSSPFFHHCIKVNLWPT